MYDGQMTMETPTPRIHLWKVLLPILLVALGVVGGLYFLKSRLGDQPRPALVVGNSLPDFQLYPIPGKPDGIAVSSLKAKVTLVNFWASWCEACMIEMPSIVKLREAKHSKGLEVALINVDENPEAVVPPILKQLGIGFSTYFDKDSQLSDLFDVHAIPLTVILDQNRKILLIESGERDWNSNEIQEQVEQWLKQ
jgi:thiol-disulfide isomerase/thioredoxin